MPESIVSVGPVTRTKRSLVQVIVAYCVALPAALVLVPIPSKYDGYVAGVLGVAAAFAFIVPAAQNYLEGTGAVPTLFGGPNRDA